MAFIVGGMNLERRASRADCNVKVSAIHVDSVSLSGFINSPFSRFMLGRCKSFCIGVRPQMAARISTIDKKTSSRLEQTYR